MVLDGRGGRLRPPGHHDRGATGCAAGATWRPRAALRDVRQARPVLVALPFFADVPVEFQADGRGVGALAHRGPRLPLRPGRPPARRPEDAAGPGRLRPRRGVHAACGSRRSRSLPVAWDPARYARAGTPARPAGGESPGAASCATSVSTASTCATTSTGGSICRCCRCSATRGSGQHPLVAGAFDAELRCAPARGRRPGSRARRRAVGLPDGAQPRRRVPQQPAGAGGVRRLRADRLRLLDPQPDRLRPRPAAGR